MKYERVNMLYLLPQSIFMFDNISTANMLPITQNNISYKIWEKKEIFIKKKNLKICSNLSVKY